MTPYPLGFEENQQLRSDFIRDLTMHQIHDLSALGTDEVKSSASIPKTLVQYWHDPTGLPEDVAECLLSWRRLTEKGYNIRLFNDKTAKAYIEKVCNRRELEAFARCHHPAMRCDYFRMCFILAEGGLYVDADDVLLDGNLSYLFRDGTLKLHPLCYNLETNSMVPAKEIWRSDLPTDGKIFYVNNNPIVAPANHPVIRRALTRATNKLLDDKIEHEIQETTGPGNLTASLAAHANELMIAGKTVDYELLENWENLTRVCWDLSYRNDSRNWRNIDAAEFCNPERE